MPAVKEDVYDSLREVCSLFLGGEDGHYWPFSDGVALALKHAPLSAEKREELTEAREGFHALMGWDKPNRINAKENHLSGRLISCPDCKGVIKEGHIHECLGGNPYRDQDGTATNFGCPSPGTRLWPPVAELFRYATELLKGVECGPENHPAFEELRQVYLKNRGVPGPKPMTDAERELVDAAVAYFTAGGVTTTEVAQLADKVVRERKPPEPRPITPEELAVVEAARKLGQEELCLGPNGGWATREPPRLTGARMRLAEALRRLPLTGVSGKSGYPYP